jgi:uncharacterized membrane protein YidH (DUF202 family)
MEKINWGRVVLGGMVAGVVLTVLATASTALFIGQHALQTAVQALRPSTSGSAAPIFFILVFVFLGNVLTWSYTAMRPRFGPGPKTAAIAGFSVWLTAVAIGVAGFAVKSMAMGEPYSLPSGPMWPMLYLVMIVASTIAGAWVYNEQQP